MTTHVRRYLKLHLPTVVRPHLADSDLLRRGDWREFTNMPMTEAESAGVRFCIRRNRPYGTETWARTTPERLGLQSSIRSRRGQTRPSHGVPQIA